MSCLPTTLFPGQCLRVLPNSLYHSAGPRPPSSLVREGSRLCVLISGRTLDESLDSDLFVRRRVSTSKPPASGSVDVGAPRPRDEWEVGEKSGCLQSSDPRTPVSGSQSGVPCLFPLPDSSLDLPDCPLSVGRQRCFGLGPRTSRVGGWVSVRRWTGGRADPGRGQESGPEPVSLLRFSVPISRR